jgi:hypothetical protein
VSINWGDVPTWVATSFGAVASFAAWRAFRSQQTQLKDQHKFITKQNEVLTLQHHELMDAAQSRRRAQARQVSVYSGIEHKSDGLPSGLSVPLRVATIKNESGEPIEAVNVRFGSYVPKMVLETFGTGRWSTPPLALLGPHQGANFFSPSLSSETLEGMTALLRLMDHQGVQWELDETGKLTELHERSAW